MKKGRGLRAYVEISNVCNLNCSFCPGTKRAPRVMSRSEFRLSCERLYGIADELLFHVMGEPLCHPELDDLLKIAGEYGFKVSITTNGTLLDAKKDLLFDNVNVIKRVSISLHSLEGNGKGDMDKYLSSAVSFAKRLASLGSFAVFRLWNLDSESALGKNSENGKIESYLKEAYPGEWTKRYSGYRIAERTFLEYDGVFIWPSESELAPEDEGSCHALRHQIAVLADGTVVPCCLDSEGQMPLGNIFDTPLSDILKSETAVLMQKGFEEGRLYHPLCKKCSFRHRFNKE
ncbi:MAG: SPASM domain-containing protein [Clostridia bacterium]|nr:SPASM domain-containing protein [Clostridia bacterium]